MNKAVKRSLKPSVVMLQKKSEFTKSDLKIYNYIINHKESIIYYSLTEMSDACGVAEATILRFFKKLDYKGFQDFKFMLAQEISNLPEKGEEQNSIEKIKYHMIQAIEDSADVTNESVLESIIDKLDEADDIVIYGIGASGIAAMDMQNRLMRIGKQAQVVTDSHFQIMRAVTSSSETVVVAISLTGSTRDIVDAVKIASENGATIITLTNHEKSPLTKFADFVLLSAYKENPLDSGSLIAKISQLYTIDLICTGLTLKNLEQSKKVKMKISENASSKLY
ncbi:MurR/RpiR family transcriptional regulator [Jeotgalibacillus malaysiensis]|uniref:MurR/RpiR family transcriptional regulator n=1 Tax=Jeotgalibacillus malaysiensis TaxID=1508404 RepID=UPI00384F7B72